MVCKALFKSYKIGYFQFAHSDRNQSKNRLSPKTRAAKSGIIFAKPVLHNQKSTEANFFTASCVYIGLHAVKVSDLYLSGHMYMAGSKFTKNAK